MVPLLIAATLAAVSSVDAYRGHDRLLIVFAPTVVDAALARQREGADVAAFAERDLRVIEVVGGVVTGATDTASSLRARFDAPLAMFRVILIGKDGHVALDSLTPVSAARLDATIDAMPMRRDEMRTR